MVLLQCQDFETQSMEVVFTASSNYATVALGIVILSVRMSIHHMHAL